MTPNTSCMLNFCDSVCMDFCHIDTYRKTVSWTYPPGRGLVEVLLQTSLTKPVSAAPAKCLDLNSLVSAASTSIYVSQAVWGVTSGEVLERCQQTRNLSNFRKWSEKYPNYWSVSRDLVSKHDVCMIGFPTLVWYTAASSIPPTEVCRVQQNFVFACQNHITQVGHFRGCCRHCLSCISTWHVTGIST